MTLNFQLIILFCDGRKARCFLCPFGYKFLGFIFFKRNADLAMPVNVWNIFLSIN